MEGGKDELDLVPKVVFLEQPDRSVLPRGCVKAFRCLAAIAHAPWNDRMWRVGSIFEDLLQFSEELPLSG